MNLRTVPGKKMSNAGGMASCFGSRLKTTATGRQSIARRVLGCCHCLCAMWRNDPFWDSGGRSHWPSRACTTKL